MHAFWKTLYNDWKTKAATYAGATRALTNKMESLTRQEPEEGSILGRWENKIAGKYPQVSSKYRAIFPHGRTGVSAGTLEERVSALSQLADRVEDAGGLPAELVTEIKDFAAAAERLRGVQQGHEGIDDVARIALEPQRVAMARMLYKNLGALMDIHADNPPAITGYFDLSVLRETGGAPPPEEPEDPAPSAPPEEPDASAPTPETPPAP